MMAGSNDADIIGYKIPFNVWHTNGSDALTLRDWLHRALNIDGAKVEHKLLSFRYTSSGVVLMVQQPITEV